MRIYLSAGSRFLPQLPERMRAHYLQHVSFEGLGCIEPWLRTAGYEITCTRLYESEAFPPLEEIDCLIVMGGPMSANDLVDCPWLYQEMDYIRAAIDAGKAVLGICLGAQLIAKSMGARVYPNPEKEIGWFPVQGVAVDSPLVFKFPASATVFHWHGETFDLPPGATLLAKSAACANQAFQIGDRVVGLQFHLETTPESAEAIVSNCRAELIESSFVQSETDILSADLESYESINRLMKAVLEFCCR